jgi:hypothetical protein
VTRIQCTACEKTLRGGTDTFGDWDLPFCFTCYAELNGNGGCGGDYYGLAPHHHDLSVTGSIIGSTVFDPLPEPNEYGEYVIGNQIFMPDPEAPRLGVWSYRTPPGWR